MTIIHANILKTIQLGSSNTRLWWNVSMVFCKGMSMEPLTGRRYHSIGRVLSQYMLIPRIVASELLRAVWICACIPPFEMFLLKMPRQAFFLHFNRATDPVTPQYCLVWTYDAVAGAQMLGKFVTKNKLVANGVAHHPTTAMVVVLGLVRKLCIMQEPCHVLRSI